MGKSNQIVEKQFSEKVDWVQMQKLSHIEKILGEMATDVHYREDYEKLREEYNRLRKEFEDLKNELHEPYSIEGMCKKLGVCENTLSSYREDGLLDFCTDGRKKIWFLEAHLQEFYQKTDTRYNPGLKKPKRVNKNKTKKI